MDSDRGPPAEANTSAEHVIATVNSVRDVDQGTAPVRNSPSLNVSEHTSSPEPNFTPEDWQFFIAVDRTLSDAGIEYDPDTQIDDAAATNRLWESMSTDHDEVLDVANEPEPQNFYTITKPGSLLPPPLAMPRRPSTISNMRVNLNFDISDSLTDDADAEPSPNVTRSVGPTMPGGDLSVDNVLPSVITKDKFDPAVSFEEYLRLSQSQVEPKAWGSTSLTELRGYVALTPKRTEPGIKSLGSHERMSTAEPEVDILKNAFKAGQEDLCLPVFSDPAYDEEFAAFAAAGRSVNQQFQNIGQEFESRKAAATTTPSPSHVSGQQASESSPAEQDEDEFTRAGLIYVAHVLQQNPELSNTPENSNHSYTEEEIQWARLYLSPEVKAWMKQNCGVNVAAKPARAASEKVSEKAAQEPKLFADHTVGPSSQKPEKQIPKATAENLNYWAEHDKMMSLSELETEWDAFEKTNSLTQMVVDNFEGSAKPPAAASTLTLFSPTSVASFVTAEDDEMSMIPTFSTPNPVAHTLDNSLTDNLNKTITPKASASKSNDLKLAPIVTKLSEILLDNGEEQSTEIILQEVEKKHVRESGSGREVLACPNSAMNISENGEVLAEGYYSPMKISGDEQEPSGTDQIPSKTSDSEHAISEDQAASKIGQDSNNATSENESGTPPGTANIIDVQRETNTKPWLVSKSTQTNAEQSVCINVLQAPQGMSFSSEVSAPSLGLSTSTSSNSVPASDTPSFTCIKCSKVYKKKAHLLKHEAEGNCKSVSLNPPSSHVFASVPMKKLSMTDQELIDNGLPSVAARNHKNLSYCTACDKEFSNVGRLRLHILQFCPILRGRGVYNKPQNQLLALDSQDLALALPNSTNKGYLLIDEGESEIDDSRPFSKSDLGNLKESLSLSDTPINTVGADSNFAPNTINRPHPSSAIKRALFPVSMRSSGPIKFPEGNDGVKQTSGVRRAPGKVVELTSRQVKRSNITLPGDTDPLVMEEANISEKVNTADNMVELPALGQSYDPSPLKSVTPALIRSTARSQNIQGAQAPTSKHGRGTATLEDNVNSPQIDAAQKDKSESLLLPRMRDDNTGDDEKPGLKYPARMRLFSRELAFSSPHKSDPLEPFEDLPQRPKHISTGKAGGVLPGFARSTPQSTSTPQDTHGNPSSVIFSFINERLCAIATQRLEELIIGSTDPTLQSLRMWPSFSMGTSVSKPAFEFKVTAPKNVHLVSTLRELFPLMVTRMRGDQVLFVPGDMAGSESGSPTALSQSAVEVPAAATVNVKPSKKARKQAFEQPRRSSRPSDGAPDLGSESAVMENESQDSKEVKRRRSSSRRKSHSSQTGIFRAIGS